MRCLGCHYHIIKTVPRGERNKEVWSNHHGNVEEVHLVGLTILVDTFTELNKSLSVCVGKLNIVLLTIISMNCVILLKFYY